MEAGVGEEESAYGQLGEVQLITSPAVHMSSSLVRGEAAELHTREIHMSASLVQPYGYSPIDPATVATPHGLATSYLQREQDQHQHLDGNARYAARPHSAQVMARTR
eukprot:2836862-Rhodomonas_salina.11